MKLNTRKLLFICAAIALGLSFAVAATSSNLPQKSVVVSYQAESRVSLHEPIFVNVTISNGLDQGINFDFGNNDKGNFSVTVTNPGGVRVRVPNISVGGLSFGGRHSLDPSGSYSRRLLMNEWFDFNEIGIYKIELSLNSPIQTVSGKRVDAQVNHAFTVKIEPRNPTRLKEKCEGLLKIIETSNDYSEILSAATALSYIHDEVTIPYLKSILRSQNDLGMYALTGLGRIANAEARSIIKEALHDPREDQAAFAKWVLEQIASGKPLQQTDIPIYD